MNWGYIAGFIDADGNFTLAKRRNNYEPRIKFTNTNKQCLEEIKRFLGVNLKVMINNKKGKPSFKPHWKESYVLCVGARKDIKFIIDHVYEHLVIKKKQAKILLRFIEIRENKNIHRKDLVKSLWSPGMSFDEEEAELYKQMMTLNLAGGKRRQLT